MSRSLSFFGRIYKPERRHECCPVRATGSDLPCTCSLKLELKRQRGVMPRIWPLPTRFPTNIFYTVLQHTFALYTKCVAPVWLILSLGFPHHLAMSVGFGMEHKAVNVAQSEPGGRTGLLLLTKRSLLLYVSSFHTSNALAVIKEPKFRSP